MPTWKIIAVMTMLGTTTGAWASVDTSSKPGGVFRLKPGIYVPKEVDCGSARLAGARRYDGQGIGRVNGDVCRARVLSRRRDRYEVSQSCVQAGRDQVSRVAERQTVTVIDALTFTLRTRGGGATYRYCPASMLPANLRGEAR